MATAIETIGTVSANHQLILDDELPKNAPHRVRVIVLFDDDTDINEVDWLRAAAQNDAFDFLNDEEEDIYTAADGKPLTNEE